MKAGDVVYHRPTKETWVLGAVEEDRVYPLGWPECVARIGDCDLETAADPEAHLNTLLGLADGASASARARAAWRNLKDAASAARNAASAEPVPRVATTCPTCGRRN